MKIIFNETKTKEIKKLKEGPLPEFNDVASKIINDLKELPDEKLLKALNVKIDKLDLEKEKIKRYGSVKGNAIFSYTGTAFKALDPTSLKNEEYLKEHVVILSSLYGPLKPFAKISDYRLEMEYGKIYYADILKNYFKDEDYIINLASKEFSSLIKTDNLINIYFIDQENKQKSMESKKMRGLLLRYLIENEIENIELIKEYQENNYSYCKTLSDTNNIYFKKNN